MTTVCSMGARKILISGVCLLMMAACQSKKDAAGPPLLNGNWASSDGVYTAEFRNGSFRAIANDTGGVISEGNYIAQSDTLVQINWFGVVSGKNNTAQCNKPSVHQLDCVDQTGVKFTLRRAGA